jgi:hypothetical protein
MQDLITEPGVGAGVAGCRRARVSRALLPALAPSCATAVTASAADEPTPHAPRPAGLAPLPKVTSARLYVVDCGTLVYNRPEDYRLSRDEVADTNMSVPCFLAIAAAVEGQRLADFPADYDLPLAEQRRWRV